MTLPKSIMMGGHRIKIQVLDDFEDYGQYHTDKELIQLRKMPIDLMASTLRHEMIHAALHLGGVSYMEKYDEESIVRCLDSIFWPSWEKVEKRLR